MYKTGIKVEGDVFAKLRGSALAAALTGGVYRDGTRPRDSRLEDAVVIFTAGLTGEVQRGEVTINIFVPDIMPWDNGVAVPDGARLETLSELAAQWVESLNPTSNYRFTLAATIHVTQLPERAEHFIVVKLGYQYYGGYNDN